MSQKSQTNTSSVISLTVGILSLLLPFVGSLLSIIGILFSIKAVKEINKTNENGMGLAIAGLICSILGVIWQLLMVLGLIAYFSPATTISG